jgi:hypothetical protein
VQICQKEGADEGTPTKRGGRGRQRQENRWRGQEGKNREIADRGKMKRERATRAK